MSMNPAITLARLIEILCSNTKDAPSRPEDNPFHLYNLPPISFDEFAERLGYYMACSPECFVVAAAYARRLHHARPDLFTTRSCHKIMLTSLLLGIKFTDDCSYPTKHYARCGGVPTDELIHLEAAFLSALGFSLFVSDSQYAESLMLLREVHKRGVEVPVAMCSYTMLVEKPQPSVCESSPATTITPSAAFPQKSVDYSASSVMVPTTTANTIASVFASSTTVTKPTAAATTSSTNIANHLQPAHHHNLRPSRHRRIVSETAVPMQFC